MDNAPLPTTLRRFYVTGYLATTGAAHGYEVISVSAEQAIAAVRDLHPTAFATLVVWQPAGTGLDIGTPRPSGKPFEPQVAFWESEVSRLAGIVAACKKRNAPPPPSVIDELADARLKLTLSKQCLQIKDDPEGFMARTPGVVAG